MLIEFPEIIHEIDGYHLSIEKAIKIMNKEFSRTLKYRNDFYIDRYNFIKVCRCCEKEKNLYLFPNSKKSRDSKEKICKTCKTKNYKSYCTEKDLPFRRIKDEIKKDKKCKLCGCDNIRFLEFDHINRTDKKYTIGHLRDVKKIEEEIKHIQILCIWCHRIKTSKEVESNKVSHNDLIKNIKIVDDDQEGKVCPGPLCKGKKRSLNEFYKRPSRKTNICSHCKTCMGFTSFNIRKKKTEYVINYKLKIGKCQNDKCNKIVTLSNYMCFDFDHLDPKTKIDTVSNLTKNSRKLNTIINEIEKCQLLCCFCHRIKTIDQLGYYKNSNKI